MLIEWSRIKWGWTYSSFYNFEKDYLKKKNLIKLEKSKIKKKKSLYNICATIVKKINLDQYEILIEKDYIDHDLYKFDICLANYNIMKKVNYNVWFKILNS